MKPEKVFVAEDGRVIVTSVGITKQRVLSFVPDTHEVDEFNVRTRG